MPENATPVAPVQNVVHTPGPWRPGRADKSYDAGIPDNAFAVFADPKHRQDCGLKGNAAVICVIAKPERMTEEDIANAQLIAAAPMMLAALRRIVRHQDYIGGSMASMSSTRHIAAQAIQHATGEVV